MIICICIVICVCISINLFYFVFSAVFIGEGKNLTISPLCSMHFACLILIFDSFSLTFCCFDVLIVYNMCALYLLDVYINQYGAHLSF